MTQSDVRNLVATTTAAAESHNAHPAFVMYNEPGRDCGGDSSGGAQSADAYQAFNAAAASATKGHSAAVLVFEPDALGFLTKPECGRDVSTKLDMVAKAMTAWKTANPQHRVFVATSTWSDSAVRQQAGFLKVLDAKVKGGIDGFAADVSTDTPRQQEIAKAEKLAELSGMGYIIDTGRSGGASPGYVTGSGGHAVDQPSRGIGPAPSGVAYGTHHLGSFDIKPQAERDGDLPTGHAPGDDPGWQSCQPSAGTVCYFLGGQLARHASSERFSSLVVGPESVTLTPSGGGNGLVIGPGM